MAGTAEENGMPSFSFMDRGEYALMVEVNAMFQTHSENNDDEVSNMKTVFMLRIVYFDICRCHTIS